MNNNQGQQGSRRGAPRTESERLHEVLQRARATTASVPGVLPSQVELFYALQKCPDIKPQIQELCRCRGLSEETKMAAINGIVRLSSGRY